MIKFVDRLKVTNKEVISLRDGIQKYNGIEIGMGHGSFRVYRSPTTIRSINLVGLPITDGHKSQDEPYTAYGSVLTSEVIDSKDDETLTTIAVKNRIKTCDDLTKHIDNGKNELSLGYSAKIVDKRKDDGVDYDFEQQDITPHHLAVVDNGRCGKLCKFLDKSKKEKIVDEKNFNDSISTYEDTKNALNRIMSLLNTFDSEERETLLDRMYDASNEEMSEEDIERAKQEEEEEEVEDMLLLEDEIQMRVDEQIADHIAVVNHAFDAGLIDDSFDISDASTQDIIDHCVCEHWGDDHGFSDDEMLTIFKTIPQMAYSDIHDGFGDGDGGSFVDKEMHSNNKGD